MRVRIGYQLSITALFVSVVLAVGLALVVLSFDRARSISRSAALTFIDRVAEHTADRVDGQFKAVLSTLEVLKQLPPVQAGAISDNPSLYATLAALLRQHSHLYNLYVGYDDGTFIELDALDRAGAAVRARFGAPEAAAFRLIVIDKSPAGPSRTRSTLLPGGGSQNGRRGAARGGLRSARPALVSRRLRAGRRRDHRPVSLRGRPDRVHRPGAVHGGSARHRRRRHPARRHRCIPQGAEARTVGGGFPFRRPRSGHRPSANVRVPGRRGRRRRHHRAAAA